MRRNLIYLLFLLMAIAILLTVANSVPLKLKIEAWIYNVALFILNR
ncbi:hypothetical protein [Erwinia endophytica]|nr:hypothetical protein [Erwinia endophytica]